MTTTRLRGSGLVPRIFAVGAFAVVSVFLGVWLAADASGWPLALAIELAVAALAVRSLFVGVFLAGDGVLVRGWFRDFRYGPGELTAVVVLPYWRFLDPKDPVLGLLSFRPASGWVREVGATVASRERVLTHAAEVRRHLGLEPVGLEPA
ncbi:MAG TPA: hypothetical protein VL294_08730 [Pseudolysinimonas sp.]|nr:hypothetical protein [Pseudolysinimonas sp.]